MGSNGLIATHRFSVQGSRRYLKSMCFPRPDVNDHLVTFFPLPFQIIIVQENTDICEKSRTFSGCARRPKSYSTGLSLAQEFRQRLLDPQQKARSVASETLFFSAESRLLNDPQKKLGVRWSENLGSSSRLEKKTQRGISGFGMGNFDGSCINPMLQQNNVCVSVFFQFFYWFSCVSCVYILVLCFSFLFFACLFFLCFLFLFASVSLSYLFHLSILFL